MSDFKCCLCGQIVDDNDVEVRHYGLKKSACKPCVDELNEMDDAICH